MKQLLVRNVEDTIVRKLKQRAGEHGVSVEEEHRNILRDALLDSNDQRAFHQHILSMPADIPDDIFERKRELDRDIVL